MKGRIKIGTPIMHDFSFGKWPTCKAPAGSKDPDTADDPDMLFEITKQNGTTVCTADGFGATGHYGNGSIYIR